MMYYTHLAFGFLIALLSIEFFDIKNKLIFILVVVMFSIFPDIDEKKSKIGKKYRWASTIINYIFGHRGFFHSIYIPLALYFIFYYINNEIGVAILAGYFSHLFMDALTKNGIRPLYPIINKKINGFIKTNSILEKILFLIIFLSILYSLLLIYL
ncbi:MAG: metal-dependent hydrolase [Nanoarchaeota archaeon]|nr:metal-dependent hydrolase [Nanoarchaeota archaeon]